MGNSTSTVSSGQLVELLKSRLVPSDDHLFWEILLDTPGDVRVDHGELSALFSVELLRDMQRRVPLNFATLVRKVCGNDGVPGEGRRMMKNSNWCVCCVYVCVCVYVRACVCMYVCVCVCASLS